MTLGEGCRGKPNCGNEIASIFFEGVHPKKSEQLTSQTGWTKKTLYFLGWEGSCQRWWLIQNNSHHLQFFPSNCCSESQRNHFLHRFHTKCFFCVYLSGPFRSFHCWLICKLEFIQLSCFSELVSDFAWSENIHIFHRKEHCFKGRFALEQSTDALHILLKQIIYMI